MNLARRCSVFTIVTDLEYSPHVYRYSQLREQTAQEQHCKEKKKLDISPVWLYVLQWTNKNR